MKALWNIRTILLLPPLLVIVLATVISFFTLYYLKVQFDQARAQQSEYMALVVDAERLSEHTLDVHRLVRDALQGAISGEVDELNLYYIHSDVVNELAKLQRRVQQFADRPEVRNNAGEELESFRNEFENYRRFMIMATDIIAIDTSTADQYADKAHDHFIHFTHSSHTITGNLLQHVNTMQDNDMLLLERSYQHTLFYGLLGMLLVYIVVRLVSRKLSECLMLIANALKLLGAQHQEPPELPEITALQQRAQGEIKYIVDALSQFQQALVDRHKQDKRIQQLAYFDPLTGLANRRLLLEHLQNALDAITEDQQHCALMFIDLDNFKNINDTIGHSAGDEILQQVAERIVHCIGNTDIAAHTGGDEFIILLEKLSEKPHEAAARITHIGEKILATLNQPFWLGSHQYNITASIGISLTNHADDSIDQIMLNADLALHQAKATGKNGLRFFDPVMQEVVSHRTKLESELRQAIQQQQLLLHYQPQVDRSGQLLGYEALIRWQHPERGMVSPAEFIPLAEETGLIIEIGNWVMHTACKQLYEWRSDPKKSLHGISVNVSSLQFAQEDFPKQVSMAVMDTGANPSRLKLELTESLLLDNVDDTIDKMKAITRMGIHFALDDFGTGYSSLSYLKHLPLSWLKIDQSFVRDMLSDSEDEAIVRTIIVLAKTLSLTVIAEGVETEEQYQHLLRLDCDEFQGYYFGRPAPLE